MLSFLHPNIAQTHYKYWKQRGTYHDCAEIRTAVCSVAGSLRKNCLIDCKDISQIFLQMGTTRRWVYNCCRFLLDHFCVPGLHMLILVYL